MSSLIYRK